MPLLKNKIINHEEVDYDPSWVVKLAKQQIPNQEDVIANLKKCKKVVRFCRCGCGDPYFIKPEEWDFNYNEVLTRDDGVEVILDIMKDNRVGGIEIGEWDKKK